MCSSKGGVGMILSMSLIWHLGLVFDPKSMRSVQPALYCSELLATPNWYRQIHTLFTQTPHGNSTTYYHVTSGSDTSSFAHQ